MALKAGKPVYVEKPVTINSASVERMMAMENSMRSKQVLLITEGDCRYLIK
jgi:predicted dehydrogenase